MLRFADDFAVLTEDKEGLRKLLHFMDKMLSEEYKLKINIGKTELCYVEEAMTEK